MLAATEAAVVMTVLASTAAGFFLFRGPYTKDDILIFAKEGNIFVAFWQNLVFFGHFWSFLE